MPDITESLEWDWTRYWSPADQLGFKSITTTLAELRDERVLILVGSPGAGKSTELRKERDSIEALSSGVPLLSIDSKHTSATEHALDQLWFSSRQWANWLESSEEIWVFLDGLDEFLNRNSNLAEYVLRKLRDDLLHFHGANQRLKLRIASRTIGLPSNFAHQLAQIAFESRTPDGAILVAPHGSVSYVLQPLTDDDIRVATSATEIDSNDFLEILRVRGYRSMARRPKLLKWLLREYSRSRSLFDTYEDVYWHGLCELLIDESRPIDPAQLMLGAARMAFVMAFTKTNQLKIGTTHRYTPGEALGVNVFLQQGYPDSHHNLPLTTDQIGVLCQSDLFAASEDGFTWSELPDMEFLAAKYAKLCGLPTHQLLGFLQNPLDPKRRVVPELSNIAAQIAALDDEVFEEVLKFDPGLLIRADAALQDERSRRKVLTRLLDAFESGALIKSQWYERDHFSLLVFDGMAEVLKPYILDQSLRRYTREMAIAIARDCHLHDLTEEIGKVVTSCDEDEVLRRSAADALSSFSTSESISIMLDLLSPSLEGDDLDELKGLALRTLWPTHVSLEQILPCISPPRSEVVGTYRLFLGQGFVEGIPDHQMARAYEWYGQLADWDDEMFSLTRIEDSLLERASTLLPDDAAVQFIASRLTAPGGTHLLSGTNWSETASIRPKTFSPEGRRALVEHLVQIHASSEGKSKSALHTAEDMYQALGQDQIREDINWIIEQATDVSSSPEISQFWFELLRWTHPVFDANDLSRVYFIYLDERYTVQLGELFAPVDLTSQKAIDLKRSWEMFGPGLQKQKGLPDSSWFREKLSYVLTRFLETSVDRWFNIDQLLRSTSDGRMWPGTYISRSAELENWGFVTEGELGVFITAAMEYLLQYQPNCSMIDAQEYFYVDQAAYRAMTFLIECSDSRLDFLTDQDWQRLGPVLFSMPPKTSSDPPAYLQELLHRAFESGFEWEPWLDILLRADDSTGYNYLPIVNAMSLILEQDQLSAWAYSVLSSGLDAGAKRHVGSVIGSHFPSLVVDQLLILASDRSLGIGERSELIQTSLHFFQPDHWQQILSLFDSDEELFETTMRHYANWERPTKKLSSNLSEAQIADLYRRLAKTFPIAEDVVPMGLHMVTSSEMIGRWRNELIYHLVGRGTWDAAAELWALSEEYPEVDWLPIRAVEAEDQAREQTWIPHQVEDMLRFLPATGARVVRSEEQLQAVIVESLQRLNQELQGASPSAVELWTSNRGEKTGVPKDEETLSDHIKRFLDRDFHGIPVFSNREVNNTPLQRNDILVECATAGSDRKLRVVCEVKGCWNPDIRNNMKTQLVDQYLKSNGTKYGVFVVGFFDTNSWPPTPKGSEHRERRHSIESVRADLIQQADTIRSDGYSVIPFVLDCRLPWDISAQS